MNTAPITTTLAAIRALEPCQEGWRLLKKHLGDMPDNQPFPMVEILNSNGLKDCLWALRSRPDLSSLWRLLAVDCARKVEHLMTDERSINALNVAECYALGNATDEELEAARIASSEAASSAARVAACVVAWNACAPCAASAADAAVRVAARVAARNACAPCAASAAGTVARATWNVASDEAPDDQIQMLREVLMTGKRAKEVRQ